MEFFYVIYLSIMCPIGLFYVLIVFRDYSSRKEFLTTLHLKETTGRLVEEQEKIENLLKSTISNDLFEKLNSSSFSAYTSSKRVIIVRFDFKLSHRDPDPEQFLIFERISGFIQQLEKTCSEFDFKMIKATLGTLIFSEIQDENELIKGKKISIEKALQFSFQSLAIYNQITANEGNLMTNCTASVDIGNITSGIIGTRKFIYDCYGETISRTFSLSETCRNNEVLVTDRVKDTLGDSKYFEFDFIQTYGDVLADGKDLLNIYAAREKKSVWGMFASYIDWMEASDLVEEAVILRKATVDNADIHLENV